MQRTLFFSWTWNHPLLTFTLTNIFFTFLYYFHFSNVPFLTSPLATLHQTTEFIMFWLCSRDKSPTLCALDLVRTRWSNENRRHPGPRCKALPRVMKRQRKKITWHIYALLEAHKHLCLLEALFEVKCAQHDCICACFISFQRSILKSSREPPPRRKTWVFHRVKECVLLLFTYADSCDLKRCPVLTINHGGVYSSPALSD